MPPIGLRIFYQKKALSTTEYETEIFMNIDDLSAYNMFTRGGVSQAIDFAADLVAKRTKPNERKCVEHLNNFVYTYAKDSLVVCFVCSEKYDDRAAYTLLNQVFTLFVKAYPESTWATLPVKPVKSTEIAELFLLSKNPEDVDPMLRIKRDLDDTRSIMHQNLEQVLNRGEKLDDLVASSEYLTNQSKQFYKTAKQTNSCCLLL